MHPASGVQPWEQAYPAMAKAMGIDPATRKYVPFDITDKKYATNYMALLHQLPLPGPAQQGDQSRPVGLPHGPQVHRRHDGFGVFQDQGQRLG